MKNAVINEYRKLISIQSSSELYLIFFRLVQIISSLGLLYFLIFVLPFFAAMQASAEMSAYMNPFMIFTPVALGFLQIGLAEYSMRSIQTNRFRGTVIGLVMAGFLLPSWAFLLGFFGFYSLLNAGFQTKFLQNSPEPFKEFLSALNINKLKMKDSA